jgi:ATP/maltotriose-dependent transcriptional regulator MalT
MVLLEDRRATALLEAARAARSEGLPARTLELLDEAFAATENRVLRARIHHVRVQVLNPFPVNLATYEALVTEAAGIEKLDAGVASRLYADAALAAVGSDVAAAVAAADLSRSLAESADDRTRAYAMLAQAAGAIESGRAPEAARLMDDAVRYLGEGDPAEAVRELHQLAVVLFYLERYDDARGLLNRASTVARTHGVRAPLAIVLDTISVIDSRVGRFSAAVAKSTEALRLAREHDDTTQIASCLTTLATIDAIQGRDRRCRERLREAVKLVAGDHLVHAWALNVEALLDLGLGRPAAVAAAAPKVEAAIAALGGQPTIEILWLPVAIESYCRLGERVKALASLDRLCGVEAELGTPSARLASARCRGLLAAGAEAWSWFEHALSGYAESPRPFERARTELCYGERLRRSRRRRDAQGHLESALATFERLRAVPWAARTRRELAAVTTGRRKADAAMTLTRHERQVAALVTQGATNREAAAALSVTAKTIEHHLTSIYAKLGLRSRTELARAFLLERV